MSSGAQCQVAIKGIQDTHLLSPNEVTFWKSTYARHTNFAIAEIEQNFQNAAGLGRQKFTCKISRSGDLLHAMYVVTDVPRIDYTTNGLGAAYAPAVPSYLYWTNALGHAMFDEVDINIGAHQFDAHYGEFLEMWEALSAPSDRLLSEMTARFAGPAACAQASLMDQRLYVPMRFWFNRFSEQALPMVALYWHDVELTFSTRTTAQLLWGAGAAFPANVPLAGLLIGGVAALNGDVANMHMLCNFVYLDRPERAAFANSKSEYVIDQSQFLGSEAVAIGATTVNHSIRFNHPVQEIIWAIRRTAATAANDYFDFSGGVTLTLDPVDSDPFASAQVTINNNIRTPDHLAPYYRTVQPYQSHSRFPAPDRFIYCYSFGLKPEELLETGSVNMSRLDNAYLRVTYWPTAVANTQPHPQVVGNLFIFAVRSPFSLSLYTNSLLFTEEQERHEGHRGHGRSQGKFSYIPHFY
jgi:hypothetical protein